jgi:hypothetical protein
MLQKRKRKKGDENRKAQNYKCEKGLRAHAS